MTVVISPLSPATDLYKHQYSDPSALLGIHYFCDLGYTLFRIGCTVLGEGRICTPPALDATVTMMSPSLCMSATVAAMYAMPVVTQYTTFVLHIARRSMSGAALQIPVVGRGWQDDGNRKWSS